MKYKVGDKVKVRSDLKVGKIYGNQIFVKEMKKYRGRDATILEEHSNFYNIEEDKDENWDWADDRDADWLLSHRTPNKSLIRENLRNVARMGFRVANEVK